MNTIHCSIRPKRSVIRAQAKWPNFRLSRAHDLDLGSGHTAYRHASLIDLYLTYIPNFVEIEGTFCGRTDVRTDGRTFETHFIRSTRRGRLGGVDLKITLFLRCLSYETNWQPPELIYIDLHVLNHRDLGLHI